ncbi:energy transducer TonB [Portibacter lacus]|uniref:TonB C-terminal domain-containing protein n=1 Tax=Portibacter lacus TaxID=1099794 RepID=A0AA37WDF7_9BACT|nr:energy transducer TonB [Portibacter lacus]GLR16918.1 hypothetical protein GCM10007940_15330 [Portibacter lacus]
MLIKKFNIGSLLPAIILSIAFTFASCDMEKKSSTEEVSMENDKIENAVSADNNKAMETKKAEEEAMIYTIADVDMQPLFSMECASMENPVECSNEKMLQFVKDNATFPREAINRNQDGFEQVIVVIEKDGSLSNMKYVASSKTKECDGCQKAAVDVVGMMENWKPAMKDGKPVAVQMTIPVRFES